jgi:hypothetical protein
MNKSDLKEIKDIVDSALGTHLASVHEEITDLRNELKQEVNDLRRDLSRVETTLTAKIDHVDENSATSRTARLISDCSLKSASSVSKSSALELVPIAASDELRKTDPLGHPWQDGNGRAVQLIYSGPSFEGARASLMPRAGR